METPRQEEKWNRPKPEKLSKPTWWPAFMAFGATLLAWGLFVSWVILAFGAAVVVVSLTGWIGDIRDEHKQP